jgi:oxygen-independent coproporphyrinogen-3 oxidase
VAAGAIEAADWIAAYRNEIAEARAFSGPRTLTSVFFGGGTPSLMPPEVVGAVLDAAAACWPPAPHCEVTLEANPTSVEAGRMADMRHAGVNRVSLGLQALDDADLRRLGRTHSVAEGLAALAVAMRTFDRVSVDLIYARQHQTLAAWDHELRMAVELGTRHLSLYQLTIEPGTVFHARRNTGQLPGLADLDLQAEMYEVTQERCEAAGLPAYEVSNHAAPGEECRHNLLYWSGGDYAGVGPGAHGRLTVRSQRWATVAPGDPSAWLAAARAGRTPTATERLEPSEAADEYLVMGLRHRAGIDLDAYASLAGRPVRAEALASLASEGLAACDGRRIRATAKGFLLLDELIRRLAA